MRFIGALMLLMACEAEDEAPLDWAVDGDQAPPVWFAVEDAGVELLPGVYFIGRTWILEGTARSRGLMGPGLVCFWEFNLQAIAVAPPPTPGTDWSFTVRYQPAIDHRLLATGVPSVCSAATFPNGPGVAYDVGVAHDAATDEILRREGGVWRVLAPSRYQDWRGGSAATWKAALARWP